MRGWDYQLLNADGKPLAPSKGDIGGKPAKKANVPITKIPSQLE
jgi:hypothetical protein